MQQTIQANDHKNDIKKIRDSPDLLDMASSPAYKRLASCGKQARSVQKHLATAIALRFMSIKSYLFNKQQYSKEHAILMTAQPEVS